MLYRKRCIKHGHNFVAQPDGPEKPILKCSRFGCCAVRVAWWVPEELYLDIYNGLPERGRCDDEQ